VAVSVHWCYPATVPPAHETHFTNSLVRGGEPAIWSSIKLAPFASSFKRARGPRAERGGPRRTAGCAGQAGGRAVFQPIVRMAGGHIESPMAEC
jgi:hypothetical protein